MSEAAPATEPKKKGKLPVIVAIVAVLFGGGFFGMKMKGGGPKEKPKIELGKIVEIEEKLVNLSDQETFLRTVVAFHLRKDFKEETLKDVMPAIDDAVLKVLKSKSFNQVRSESGIEKLKWELATAVNQTLHDVMPSHDEDKGQPKPEGDVEMTKGEGNAKGKDGKAAKKPEKPKIPAGWYSAEGPVLKVYFRMFAVQ